MNPTQIPDPNLFRLDWEQMFEVLAAIVILASVVERALAPHFENRWWLKRWDDKVSKKLMALVVAAEAYLEPPFCPEAAGVAA